MNEGVCDITIIGAGPVGLAAAYYAGHRDASVRIVESLGQIGGQVAAVYPEKHVYDVAGHPKVLGQDLVDLCVEQGLQFGADVHLGEEVKDLERVSQNGDEILRLTTHTGKSFLTRALIVTAGHGAFEPRKLELEGLQAGFAINNPNVSASCGCGHSFQVEEGADPAADAGCGPGCSH